MSLCMSVFLCMCEWRCVSVSVSQWVNEHISGWMNACTYACISTYFCVLCGHEYEGGLCETVHVSVVHLSACPCVTECTVMSACVKLLCLCVYVPSQCVCVFMHISMFMWVYVWAGMTECVSVLLVWVNVWDISELMSVWLCLSVSGHVHCMNVTVCVQSRSYASDKCDKWSHLYAHSSQFCKWMCVSICKHVHVLEWMREHVRVDWMWIHVSIFVCVTQCVTVCVCVWVNVWPCWCANESMHIHELVCHRAGTSECVSMLMCECVCACRCLCVLMSDHIHVWACLCEYVNVFVCVNMFMCVTVQAGVWVNLWVFVYVSKFVCEWMCGHVRVYMWMYESVCVRINVWARASDYMSVCICMWVNSCVHVSAWMKGVCVLICVCDWMCECVFASWISFSGLGVSAEHSNVSTDVKICSEL